MKTQSPRCARAFPLLLCLLVSLWNVRCGAASYALQFTNNGIQSVGIQFVPELNLYPFTVTAWIKAGGQPSDGVQPTPIVVKGNAFDGWSVAIFNGEIRALYVAGGASYVSDGPPVSSSGLNGGAVADDQWHHVAFTVDVSGGKIYVDGVLRTNTAWVGTPATNQFAHPIFFGYGQFSSAQYVGLLDEVMLWNTALTQAQIQTNKNRLLTGQEPGLIAYYRLDESVGPFSYDSAPAGGTNNGFWNNVTAVLSDSPIARLPVVQTLPASSIGGTSATLNGLVNPQGTNTSAWFEWGLTTNYGYLSPTVPLPTVTNDLPFPQGITGLAVGNTYHFRGVASNSFGMAWGNNVSFTTMSGPSVTTLPASAVASTNATLNGVVNPNGTASSAWFEWGATTNYGNATPAQSVGSGTAGTNFSQIVSGFAGGVTYHFRAVASNTLGTVTGTNLSFTTAIFSLAITNLPAVSDGATAWGDYDNDGRLDLLLTGAAPAGYASQLWRNTGSGFTNVAIAGLPGVQSSSVAWGDYDNDGRLDFLITGSYNDGNPNYISQLWRNTGSGFNNVPLPGVLEVAHGSVAWGDYDNDGRLDFLITGSRIDGNPNRISQLWRNTGNGFTNVTASVAPGLPAVAGSSVAWGDYDNDGRLDFLLIGNNGNINFSQLWHNRGNGFIHVPIAGLPQVSNGSVAWADYDNDGRLDFLLTGWAGNNDLFTQLWRNTGTGFTNVPIAGLPGVDSGSVAWGDYDNDGRPDFLLTGYNEDASVYYNQLWRNTGSGFTNGPLPGLSLDTLAWGDYDNDGRLDILLTGFGTNGITTQIWRNNTPVANTPPNPPSNLSVSGSGSTVTLNWAAASDAQTPASGLSYNVRIGTTPGGSDVFSGMSGANGFRRLPALGNGQTRLFLPFNYNLDTPYYWSVQAVDTAFAGSTFAAEGNFRILSTNLMVFAATVTNQLAGDSNGDGIVSQQELDTVYANYLPTSPWLHLTNVTGLGGTNVTFTLTNDLAGAFSVEYSTNLMDWYLLGPAIPRYLFTDTNAPAVPQRSYRLRWP